MRSSLDCLVLLCHVDVPLFVLGFVPISLPLSLILFLFLFSFLHFLFLFMLLFWIFWFLFLYSYSSFHRHHHHLHLLLLAWKLFSDVRALFCNLTSYIIYGITDRHICVLNFDQTFRHSQPAIPGCVGGRGDGGADKKGLDVLGCAFGEQWVFRYQGTWQVGGWEPWPGVWLSGWTSRSPSTIRIPFLVGRPAPWCSPLTNPPISSLHCREGSVEGWMRVHIMGSLGVHRCKMISL